MSSNLYKILIADDHRMFVDGIESILQEIDNVEIAGRCHDGKKVIDFVGHHDVDMILLDVNLPEMNGIEVCERLKITHPKIKILAVSMYNQESYVSELLKHGASGYILKNTGRDELLDAIKKVRDGETFFSDAVTDTIMRSLMNDRKKTKQKDKILPKVTRREKEVLQLIVQEHTTQEIANKLYISLKTVESHRSSLLAKMNVRNSVGLVRIALENNLIE